MSASPKGRGMIALDTNMVIDLVIVALMLIGTIWMFVILWRDW